MPAVTVDDITTLARIPEVAPTAEERKVRSVTTAPSGFEARASRYAGPSREWTCATSTRSRTWIRWARWTTHQAN